ncbi:sugar kinase [Clostridium tertium]|jgi:2-dehydro-3-deoxygluconokinase|uniref:sugar kinase n=1 Tax=Clostridium TaxID=1485 RepID=UPI001D23C4CF|nr:MULTISPECIES: sugar kinase [Clostridium]MBS5306090.1 sugar kinase [Clostridium sp.]MDB1939318.1 sugar kinase [Clostridium tertium]MDB1944511.1 sugar kinase [Clostridium tertium]MDB1951778.1 sugar kinase [Clostridium tertium]
MSKVLLFGEPMALFTAKVEGDLESVNLFEKSVAGAELNVCTGLVRLGHTASYITRLGDDPLGLYIKKFINKEKIGTEFITFDTLNKTGLMFKSKVSNGDPVTAYYRKGSAFSNITSEDVDKVSFDGVELLHVTGIPPALSLSCREATYRLMERAKEKGVYITFDPNLRPALWESEEVMVSVINDLAKKCDLILPGVAEGLVLTGSGDVEKIADFYQNLGIKEVIIKNGSKGAYIRSGNESFEQPGFKVEKVVDTVGAGDGFAAGVLSGKLEGLSIRECAIRGNAIGAIQVTYSSDNEGLPTQDELKKFIEKRI